MTAPMSRADYQREADDAAKHYRRRAHQWIAVFFVLLMVSTFGWPIVISIGTPLDWKILMVMGGIFGSAGLAFYRHTKASARAEYWEKNPVPGWVE